MIHSKHILGFVNGVMFFCENARITTKLMLKCMLVIFYWGFPLAVSLLHDNQKPGLKIIINMGFD